MDSFGRKIRKLRESKNLFLRQLASSVKIDLALMSKIERGERIATKNKVIALADFFEIDRQELLALWLGEKIAYEIKDEEIANEALKVAEKAIQYLKTSKDKLTHA